MATSRRRRTHLHDRFGPEYERTVDGTGKRRRPQNATCANGRRSTTGSSSGRSALRSRERYQHDWEALQAKFVDRPQVAVTEADALVTDVMRERGYPVDDWEHKQRARCRWTIPTWCSTTGPRTRSRSAASPRGRSTEDLRVAVVSYRALFEELVEDDAHCAELTRGRYGPREPLSRPAPDGVGRTRVRFRPCTTS